MISSEVGEVMHAMIEASIHYGVQKVTIWQERM